MTYNFSYDADHDKFLGLEDLGKMMKKMGVTTNQPGDLEAMIREVDEDGDGKMSYREVKADNNKHVYALLRDNKIASLELGMKRAPASFRVHASQSWPWPSFSRSQDTSKPNM